MSQVDFESARQRNLGFGLTYGANRSVHAPHWEGTLGDEAAQSRMAFPSGSLQRYLDGNDYNHHSKLFLETALQGESRSMSSSGRLLQQDDYTPQIGRNRIAQLTEYADPLLKTEDDSPNEMLLVGIVVLGLLTFFYIANNN